MKTCAKCGVENVDDATFCANCGNAFGQPAAYPGAAAPAPPPPSYDQPPMPPYTHPAPGYPSQTPMPGIPYQQQIPYPAVARTSSGKATASLVMGIVGIFIFPIIFSVAAILMGGLARKEIAASGGLMTGDGNAVAGIILGCVGLVLWVIFIVILAVI